MGQLTTRLARIWRRRPVASLLFIVALVVTLGLTTRSVLFAVYWADPAHRDQVVAGWMTPRYIAYSWKIPPAVIQDALGDTLLPGRRLTLDDLSAERGVPVGDLIARIEAAIARHRAEAPDP
ncbi:hypothetical protein [Oceaniglobus ichthyenteri]|uniref:hypothetical protein n=1 Tax=Oceaniglobus ichthyenteri TaxID=2136177 RepID=UPI000D375ADB|nr:hypothetical protein [Oceaniglobus ichthyenteri]